LYTMSRSKSKFNLSAAHAESDHLTAPQSPNLVQAAPLSCQIITLDST
jgi:hypothetical protein